MAKKQYFENLLGAMQESILKAHSMIENQHLNVMKRYFDESQKPLTFDIQYPRINPDTGELEYVLVQVLSSWDDGKSNDSGLLANILSSNKTDTDNFVDVELLFESNDPPEAVMKINDQMVKILP